jgi:hemoglobin
MKKISLPALLIAGMLFMNATVQSQETLYKRLGGYDAIAAVTDDFLGRLLTHKDLSRFFIGTSDNSKMKIRQLVVDFLCFKSGGPCVYTGRSMKDSHKGLNISEQDWSATAGLLAESLKKFNVPAKETQEVFALVSSLKEDIVVKK